MYETSDIRKGLRVELDGDPFIVVDFQFVKPGKGNAFTRTKIRNMITGESTRVLSESRRPPAAGWEIDLQTATAPLLGLNHNRDVDITAAFPAVSMPYHGQRHSLLFTGNVYRYCLLEFEQLWSFARVPL